MEKCANNINCCFVLVFLLPSSLCIFLIFSFASSLIAVVLCVYHCSVFLLRVCMGKCKRIDHIAALSAAFLDFDSVVPSQITIVICVLYANNQFNISDIFSFSLPASFRLTQSLVNPHYSSSQRLQKLLHWQSPVLCASIFVY